jgi:hypothetical protein
MNKQRALLLIAVASTVVFSWWFSTFYAAERWPNSDVIGNIFMGLSIATALWFSIGLIIVLWNLCGEE